LACRHSLKISARAFCWPARELIEPNSEVRVSGPRTECCGIRAYSCDREGLDAEAAPPCYSSSGPSGFTINWRSACRAVSTPCVGFEARAVVHPRTSSQSQVAAAASSVCRITSLTDDLEPSFLSGTRRVSQIIRRRTKDDRASTRNVDVSFVSEDLLASGFATLPDHHSRPRRGAPEPSCGGERGFSLSYGGLASLMDQVTVAL
jgi:hypothetical protein